MKLWMKILLGLVAGIGAGAILGPQAVHLKILGTIFLGLVNMLVVPLVLASMTVGISSIHDPKKLGKLGMKTLGMFFATTLIAICIGMAFAYWLNPGEGLGFQRVEVVGAAQKGPLLKDLFVSMIPGNPITALSQGNILQIIVYAFFLGISINLAGEKGKPLLAFFESLADVMYKLTNVVMTFAPYGVFGIMAWVAGTFGLAVLIPLFKFLGTIYLAYLFHIAVVYGGTIYVLARLNPIPFFKGMSDAIALAFSTCSSSVTLPVAMHCVQKNIGVSKNIAGFVMPLGATINTNGAAAFQGCCAIFIAQAYGIPVDWQMALTIIVTSMMASLGSAGVPGTGYVMMSVVLSAAGLPLEGLAIVAGIDRVREMLSTVVNMLGDGVTALWIAKTEGELDEAQYYETAQVCMEESDV